jgi:hypothetical protein
MMARISLKATLDGFTFPVIAPSQIVSAWRAAARSVSSWLCRAIRSSIDSLAHTNIGGALSISSRPSLCRRSTHSLSRAGSKDGEQVAPEQSLPAVLLVSFGILVFGW